MPLAAALLLAATVPARAEIAADVDMAGGVETMKLGKASRPSPVLEVGMHVGYDFASWGLGVSFHAVGRTRSLFDNAEDIHGDFVLRLASDDRRVRAAFGFGVRAMTIRAAESFETAQLSGIDFAHARIAGTLVEWDLEEVGATVTLDSYVAWTLGCYSGTIAAGELPDVPATNVRCADTLTSTAVLGISLGIRNARPPHRR